MLEYARTLYRIQEFLKSNNVKHIQLKGFNFKQEIEKTLNGIKKYNFDPNLRIYSDYLGYQPNKEKYENWLTNEEIANPTDSAKEKRQNCLDAMTYQNIFTPKIGPINFYPLMFKIAEADEIYSLLNIYW